MFLQKVTPGGTHEVTTQKMTPTGQVQGLD